MKKNKTKNRISISIDEKLDEIVNYEINNKSKYIEWIIYQDLLKNSKNDKIKTLLI